MREYMIVGDGVHGYAFQCDGSAQAIGVAVEEFTEWYRVGHGSAPDTITIHAR